nr:hypothetical protein [Tanacetum cinerariifolium]
MMFAGSMRYGYGGEANNIYGDDDDVSLSYIDLSVGLILNGLTNDFARFVRNYNMHNMGKTIGKLHALLIEYEKGLPKKVVTPQVIMIQSGRIQKANKKSQNAKGKGKDKSYIPKPKQPKPNTKEHPTKNDAYHHCKEVGYWRRNCPVYLAELMKNKKQGFRGSRKLKQGDLYLYAGNGVRAQVEAIRSFDLVLPNGLEFKNEVENQLEKTIKALLSNRGGEYTSQEFKDYLKACGIVRLTPPYTPKHNVVSEKRNRTLLAMSYEALVKRDTLDKLQKGYVKCIFIGYPKETMGYYFYFPPENKIVIASKIPMQVEGFEPPREEEAPIHRSEMPHRAPDRLCLNVEAEKHSLGDLNEPTNYKAVIKWIFKKKTDMDGNVHTYKARLIENGFTQTYRVDYKETFSPVADIRGEATFILGIKIYRDRSRRLIGRCQSAYMDKILKGYRMDNSKRGYIPMLERLDLNKRQDTLDVYAQNITSRFQQNPGELHWTAMKTILKYLRNTKDMFLVYGGNPEAELRVECYCDVGFETDRDDTKSRTRYAVLILNGGVVDWKSSI